ncbi:MAG TPA: flavin reductase family protein [Syntrophorhabdaceae bacterium]|nr:flavin reductase family protein [Syntrophorhabdaceae bacterium]HQM80596.1 flavin reductase family protein [Syntrophorhabdaceae bacterium]
MKRSIGARTMVFPTPVLVVGSYDKEGKPNAMTVAWGGICCSQPPCIGISLRKATYTYGNIVERKAFTVNIATESYVKETDYLGIATGKKVDKLAAAGLTPVKSDLVDAPYIKEFPFIFECKLINTVEIGLHTQFIGEILDVKADESILDKEGLPDIEKMKPLAYTPEVRNYYGLGKCVGRSFSIGKILDKKGLQK